MNLTLEINGIDRTSSVILDSLEKSDVLNEKADTLRFAVRRYGGGTFEPAVNDVVELLDGSETIYKGLILTVQKSTEGHSVIRYDVDCVDNAHFLNRTLVLESYTDKTIDYIIDDIITKNDTNDVSTGLIAHYKLNGDATDSSGSGNNGTENGGVTYEAGKLREAAKFDGVNDYIDAGTGVSIALGGNSIFSLGAWIKTSFVDTIYTSIVGWYGGNYKDPVLQLYNGRLHATVGQGGTSSLGLISTSNYPLDTWLHQMLVYNGSFIYLYVNGELVASAACTLVDNTSGSNFVIGRNPWDSAKFFPGQVDDVRVYNRALLPAEITKLYNIGITTNHVNAPVEVKSITFNRISISAALQKLANLSNYSWYLDYENDLHFFEKNTEPAPFSITDTSENYIYDSLEVTDDISQLRNKVYVQGGEAEGDPRIEYFNGDGTKTSFKLSNKFARLPTVTVGGVSKTVGVDFLDSETDFDAFWNYNETYIRFKVAPASGTNNIVVTGIPLYSVSAQVQDPDSIDQYGMYEFAKTDKAIKSREEAKAFAASELEAYAEKVSEGRFDTYTPGLRSGQLITVNSASRDISEDFLIQKVTFRMVNNDVGIYSVELATLKTLTIIDFLLNQLRLGSRIIEEQSNEILGKFASASETISISESFTAQALNYAVEFRLGPQAISGTLRPFVLDGSRLS